MQTLLYDNYLLKAAMALVGQGHGGGHEDRWTVVCALLSIAEHVKVKLRVYPGSKNSRH